MQTSGTNCTQLNYERNVKLSIKYKRNNMAKMENGNDKIHRIKYSGVREYVFFLQPHIIHCLTCRQYKMTPLKCEFKLENCPLFFRPATLSIGYPLK